MKIDFNETTNSFNDEISSTTPKNNNSTKNTQNFAQKPDEELFFIDVEGNKYNRKTIIIDMIHSDLEMIYSDDQISNESEDTNKKKKKLHKIRNKQSDSHKEIKRIVNSDNEKVSRNLPGTYEVPSLGCNFDLTENEMEKSGGEIGENTSGVVKKSKKGIEKEKLRNLEENGIDKSDVHMEFNNGNFDIVNESNEKCVEKSKKRKKKKKKYEESENIIIVNEEILKKSKKRKHLRKYRSELFFAEKIVEQEKEKLINEDANDMENCNSNKNKIIPIEFNENCVERKKKKKYQLKSREKNLIEGEIINNSNISDIRRITKKSKKKKNLLEYWKDSKETFFNIEQNDCSKKRFEEEKSTDNHANNTENFEEILHIQQENLNINRLEIWKKKEKGEENDRKEMLEINNTNLTEVPKKSKKRKLHLEYLNNNEEIADDSNYLKKSKKSKSKTKEELINIDIHDSENFGDIHYVQQENLNINCTGLSESKKRKKKKKYEDEESNTNSSELSLNILEKSKRRKKDFHFEEKKEFIEEGLNKKKSEKCKTDYNEDYEETSKKKKYEESNIRKNSISNNLNNTDNNEKILKKSKKRKHLLKHKKEYVFTEENKKDKSVNENANDKEIEDFNIYKKEMIQNEYNEDCKDISETLEKKKKKKKKRKKYEESKQSEIVIINDLNDNLNNVGEILKKSKRREHLLKHKEESVFTEENEKEKLINENANDTENKDLNFNKNEIIPIEYNEKYEEISKKKKKKKKKKFEEDIQSDSTMKNDSNSNTDINGEVLKKSKNENHLLKKRKKESKDFLIENEINQFKDNECISKKKKKKNEQRYKESSQSESRLINDSNISDNNQENTMKSKKKKKHQFLLDQQNISDSVRIKIEENSNFNFVEDFPVQENPRGFEEIEENLNEKDKVKNNENSILSGKKRNGKKKKAVSIEFKIKKEEFSMDCDKNLEGCEDDFDENKIYLLKNELDFTFDESFELSSLYIFLPFEEIPDLHVIKRPSKPTKEQSELAKMLNAKIGPFTKEEDEKIRKNWKEFCRTHNLNLEPRVFFKFPRHWPIGEKIKFLQYLSQGLPNRTPYRVHMRFKKIFEPQGLKKGRYTKEEDDKIIEYLSQTNSSKPFRELGLLLNRSSKSIEERHYLLFNDNNNSKNNNNVRNKRIKWDIEMAERLIKTIMEVTKTSDVSDLENLRLNEIQWKEVSGKIDEISVKKLRRAWDVNVYPKLFMVEKARKIQKKLIKLLLENEENDFRAVSWEKYSKHFRGVTATKLYDLFRNMMHNVPKTMRSSLKCVLKYLWENIDSVRSIAKRVKYKFENGKLSSICNENY